MIGSKIQKSRTFETLHACRILSMRLSLGLGACGPSKQELALAGAKTAINQACDASEAAIKIAGNSYEDSLNNVLSLKAELLENIQGDNPTDWWEKYSNFQQNLSMSDKILWLIMVVYVRPMAVNVPTDHAE